MYKISIIFIVVITGFIFPAWANSDDPTRPPIAQKKSVNPVVKNKFVPKPKRQVKTKGWVLNSTLIAQDRRTAVINNKILSVGETIKGFKVLGIQPGIVKLGAKGKITVLEISKKDVKIAKIPGFQKPVRKNGK